MSIKIAYKGQLWIPYGEGIYFLQYYVAPFSITNTTNGSGAYGYGSYGSTVASGTVPAWGVSTAALTLVEINGIIYNSCGSIAELRSNHTSFSTNGYYYYSSNILYVYPPDTVSFLSSAIVLYPDMQNSPTWTDNIVYVKDAGVWKQSTMYTRVSGTWVQVT